MSRTPFRRRSLASLGLVLALAGPARGELIAERITEENWASHRVGGPDADAGVGDWLARNRAHAVLLRPDRYVAALAAEEGDLPALLGCLGLG